MLSLAGKVADRAYRHDTSDPDCEDRLIRG